MLITPTHFLLVTSILIIIFIMQLSKMRYATVSEFRGKVMVGIREYYEADGELRPGRKGTAREEFYYLICVDCHL